MKVAVLGGGFAGLATIWHLLNLLPSSHVTLFDPAGVGGGASGVSAGLLHPFGGAHAKLNRLGWEGVAATRRLLQEAARFSGKLSDNPVCREKGVLRVALNHEQECDYQTCASKHPEEVIWLSAEEAVKYYSRLLGPAIYIKSGCEVDSLLYLKSLWLACEERGAHWEPQAITDLGELRDFDVVVVAVGAASQIFSELSQERLFYTKGQILELEWPEGLDPLPYPISSHCYIVMRPLEKNGRRSCVVGATYEKSFATQEADCAIAKEGVLHKAVELIPELAEAKILSCRAGIRVSTPDHMPLIRQFGEGRWLMTGFGSKGLLYHALYGEMLARKCSS